MRRSNDLINPDEPLRQATLHYPKSGGKGFRPAMLQLVCSALGGDEPKSIPVAAAIEAVHVSSLIHDDWMDHDEKRRGVPAVWKKWNPTVAILAGDVLYGLAFAMVGEIEELSYEMKYWFSKDLAEIYIKLCEGQMLDIGFETRPFEEITVEDITHMQYLKTGVLFEFACMTGARIAMGKMDDPLIDLIREYAKLSGTAFQIQDDIIGLVGDAEKVGKPIGSDIIEGKRTLIAVHAVTNADENQKEVLINTLGNENASTDEIERCLQTMKDIGSIDYAYALAVDMAKKAAELTSNLPENDSTNLLTIFAKHMIERKF